ncbi:CbaC protein [Natrialbaceae archaeon A-gly3]
MNLRLSPAVLLIVTAFVIIVTVELRTLFDMLGVAVSPRTAAAIGGLAILTLWVWAFLPSTTGDDPKNGSGGSNHHRAD